MSPYRVVGSVPKAIGRGPKKRASSLVISTPKPTGPPKFSDFNPLTVPIAPVRKELAAYQKQGIDNIPLGDFLEMLHKIMREFSKNDSKSK